MPTTPEVLWNKAQLVSAKYEVKRCVGVSGCGNGGTGTTPQEDLEALQNLGCAEASLGKKNNSS